MSFSIFSLVSNPSLREVAYLPFTAFLPDDVFGSIKYGFKPDSDNKICQSLWKLFLGIFFLLPH